MVLELGEIILPALPPPIIAKTMASLGNPAFLPMARAIGATVITVTVIKTPTPHIIIAARPMARKARFDPSLLTISSAIFSAEPVIMSAPAKIPDVNILKTADTIPWHPVIIAAMVVSRPPPPMTPPIKAPSIKL